MSAIVSPASPWLYFGKLPTRGDFVRSHAGAALLHSIDHWLSQAMAQMAEDPRWKLVYDAAEPVHFAILGTHSHAGLVGHLSASHDASGRRYPFVIATSFDVPQPLHFIPYSPLALAPVWTRLNQVMGPALHADDFSQVHEVLHAPAGTAPIATDGRNDAYLAFTRATTLQQLEQSLALPTPASTTAPCLRQALLALGMLLQPVIAQGRGGLAKGLRLPLTPDGALLPHVLTLWLDLASGFFRRHAVEFALLVTVQRGEPLLVLGFHGASPVTLHCAMDPQTCRLETVDVTDAQWVEDWLDTDHGLRRLSNHLRDPALSVASAIALFRETFLGD